MSRMLEHPSGVGGETPPVLLWQKSLHVAEDFGPLLHRLLDLGDGIQLLLAQFRRGVTVFASGHKARHTSQVAARIYRMFLFSKLLSAEERKKKNYI